MYQVVFAIGGWDAETEEPVGGFVRIEDPVATCREAVDVMVAWSAVMHRLHGEGEMVVLDVELTRLNVRNERVNAYAVASLELYGRVALAM